MSLCASCGLELDSALALCPHHHAITGDDFASTNRVMCDLLHRGLEPHRLSTAERDDDFWSHTTQA